MYEHVCPFILIAYLTSAVSPVTLVTRKLLSGTSLIESSFPIGSVLLSFAGALSCDSSGTPSRGNNFLKMSVAGK